ncbi:MAG: molybdenum cofactor biosynthesis protein MoaE, partial [Pseudomonadota bacterium]
MSTPAVRIAVQEADFDVGVELARARSRQGGQIGAVATFVGLVRDHDSGTDGEIAELFLEHYPGVTERSIEAVVEQALARWVLADVTIIHRVGQLSG